MDKQRIGNFLSEQFHHDNEGHHHVIDVNGRN
jgi:hypothetical protein